MQAKFITSASNIRECPQDSAPEVAFLGRSNAGKSSLLNALANQKKLAMVSASPGKTRLLNFFDVDAKYRIVDLPGYGYAARSKDERIEWSEMVEVFLTTRENLQGALLVMDIRRDWTLDETHLLEWLMARDLPMAVALTKSDKLGESDIRKRKAKLESDLKTLNYIAASIFVVSSLKKKGCKELEDYIFSAWIKKKR
jgi:GTP-binding protein